jgi:hypothetical protein
MALIWFKDSRIIKFVRSKVNEAYHVVISLWLLIAEACINFLALISCSGSVLPVMYDASGSTHSLLYS